MLEKASFYDGKVELNINNHHTTKVKKHSSTIAFCVDDNYVPFALFAASQIIKQAPNFDICICLPNINKVPESFLQLPIRFIEMQILGLAKLPIDHLSFAAYHRIFLPYIFADDYEYIIYLDADIYIIRPFFHDFIQYAKKLGNFSVAAAPDGLHIIKNLPPKYRPPNEQIKYINSYENNHIYRNSGVLIFNVKNCCADNFTDRMLSYALAPNSELPFHDQSTLNRVYINNIPLLPFTFNWQLNMLNHQLIEEFQPYIIHFIGANKPWINKFTCTQPYTAEYLFFLSKNFPDSAEEPQTKLAARKKAPKYTNPIREKISLFIARTTQQFKDITRNIKYRIFIQHRMRSVIQSFEKNND